MKMLSKYKNKRSVVSAASKPKRALLLLCALMQPDPEEVAQSSAKEPLSLLQWILVAAIAVVLFLHARHILLRSKIDA